MDSYASIKITNLKKDPITREMTHVPEVAIREQTGETYNNTMNHQVKIKDTKKTILPVAGCFNNENVFKSTLIATQAYEFSDPYHTEYYNKRFDFQKKYTEEMLRAKNMMTKKKETVK